MSSKEIEPYILLMKKYQFMIKKLQITLVLVAQLVNDIFLNLL